MKCRLFFLSLTIIFISGSLVSQTVYVNKEATGANDGSSWENAFVSLASGLDANSSGDFWIAKGVYTHNISSSNMLNTFHLRGAVNLFGGFVGTETSIDERVFNENETFLSADFAGNDETGNFDSNKSDNSFHVITIDSLIQDTIIIDGLTIVGGHSGTNTDDVEYARRGGGIFTYSSIAVNNCKFQGNFANSGASIYISSVAGGGSGSSITNSTFTNNRSNARGAGIYFVDLSDILIENNSFSQNQVARGCVYPFGSDNIELINNTFSDNISASNDVFTTGVFSVLSTNVVMEGCTFANNSAPNATAIYFEGDGLPSEDNFLISECTFSGNTATDFGGADLYFWQATGVRITDCSFSGATASNGAVMYNDGSFTPLSANNLIFTRCVFKDNEASDFGGALFSWQGGMTLDSCTFEGNKATNGGGFYFDNRDKNGLGLIVRQSTFKENMSPEIDGAGGAFRVNQASLNVTNSVFMGNHCDNGASIFVFADSSSVNINTNEFSGGLGEFGGAIACFGTASDFLLENLLFSGNSASNSGGAVIAGFGANTRIKNCDFIENFASSGGAIRVRNDSTKVTILDCYFNGNESEGDGGAILMSGGDVSVQDCDFENNEAKNGGAISTFESEELRKPSTLAVIDSKFSSNVATRKGGAFDVIDTDTNITNSLINNNSNLGGRLGGAISVDASDSSSVIIDLLNCTIAGNEGEIGSGIGLLQRENDSELKLILRNTIIANDGFNFEIEEGTPTIESMGGNVVSDATLETYLNGTQDKNNVLGQIFVNYNDFDFHLADGSLAINIAQGEVPILDLEDMPRVNAPDAGVYEYQLDVNVADIVQNNYGQLVVKPNPVKDILTFSFDHELIGELSAKLFNVEGRLVSNTYFQKSGEQLDQQINIGNFPAGIYNLTVGKEDVLFAAKVVIVD